MKRSPAVRFTGTKAILACLALAIAGLSLAILSTVAPLKSEATVSDPLLRAPRR